MKKLSLENMRYKVPGVRSRFLAVHRRFIAICMLVAMIIITLTASAVVIRGVSTLEAKSTVILFCNVDDPEQVKSDFDKYAVRLNVYLAKYEERFQSKSSLYKYDFSDIGLPQYLYGSPDDDIILIYVYPDLSRAIARRFSTYDLDIDDPLNWAELHKVMEGLW